MPRSYRTLTILLLTTGLAACGAEEPRNVLLVTIDTLRQDHLGSYGADVETPHLDRIASEGFRFSSAYATAPTTLPSHTSLLTGLYPHRHGVRRNGLHRVPEEMLTLAELMSRSGRETAAFIGTAVLDSVYGLDQGFDLYDDTIAPEDSGAQEQRRADRVVEAACAWLADVEGAFFAWVHVFDPHGPYDPPAPFDRMYYEGNERDPANTSLADIPLVFYQNLDGITDRAYPLAQYKAEVSYTDDVLGRLFDALGERIDDTVLVVTADHGESLGEDDLWFDHGETLSEACMRVPLLIRAPWVGGGHTLDGPVSHVDVAPTVLELLGAPAPGFEGTSLVPALERQDLGERYVYFETFLPSRERKRPLYGVRGQDHKLLLVGRRAELLDANDGPAADERALDRLRSLIETYASQTPDVEQKDMEMTTEQEEKLRALGYVR